MYKIRREFWFSAAHRIEGHPKCGRLHGHNYKVVVEIQDSSTGKDGMVLDFGFVDEVVKPIVDAMDHRYLVSAANLIADDIYSAVAIKEEHAYILEAEHSTAECMARYFRDKICVALHWPPRDVSITVQETPRNEATYVD